MLRIYFASLVLFFNTLFVYGQNHSAAELKADLRFLQKKLKKIHPALYRYTSESALDVFFDSLHNSITTAMDEREFFSLVTLLHSKIGDGHTMILPAEATIEYNNSKGIFLPFTLAYIKNRLYIVENNSSDTSIERGEEIVSINGESGTAVVSQLMKRFIRDGYNQTYPTWILNHYFAAYYSYAYGQPSQFVLELQNNVKKNISALTKDSIKFYRQMRYPVTASPGIHLEIDKYETGILTIKSFDADLLPDYKKEYDSVFAVLKRKGITNLVLDLRDNQGGDFEPGRYLLSYLLTKPARYLLSGKEARVIQPKANHFTGTIHVLINGGSFSSTVIVSATLERERKVIFLGEETGGNKHIISGKPIETTLPNTRIRAYISTSNFPILTGPGDGRGIMPMHVVPADIKDIPAGKDLAKELVLKMLSVGKKISAVY
jgi:hypothetical protein